MSEIPVSELQPGYLGRDIGLFRMFDHYWKNVLKRKPIKNEGTKIVSMGAGDATEALPFALAIESATEADIKKYLLNKSLKPKSVVYKVDYDTEEIEKLKRNPRLAPFVDADNYIAADFNNIPVPDKTFDIILMRNPYWDDFEFSDDVFDNTKLGKAFDEIDRTLTDGGIFFQTFLSKEEYNVGRAMINRLVMQGKYKIVEGADGLSGFQTTPGIDPQTNEPWPWDKYILIAEKQAT
jgi:ubiquinone/menaquinone biosynthesis C-methylase UbiE